MFQIFEIFAVPLGYVLEFISRGIPNFMLAMLVFTLLVRLVLFPLSIKNQKSQADRARLAPRLEAIQKKYAADRNKVMQKQQELYEKEGVKMTPGCLPMIVQMLVLFSVIAVIYKPLTYVNKIPAEDLSACKTAVAATLSKDDKTEKKDKTALEQKNSYYGELYLMKYLDTKGDVIEAALKERYKDVENGDQKVAETMQTLQATHDQFNVLGINLLRVPSEYGITPNWLWLIVLASGGTAFLSSLLSMKYSKATMSQEQQQAAGCTNGMMYMMPLMSLFFSFTVPAGVAVYWTFSNLLAMVQTFVLNKMYDPAKARAKGEAELAERRRRKEEDKARLKAARLAEQQAWQAEENEKKAAAQGKAKPKKAETTATPAEQPKDSVMEEETTNE